MFDTYFSNHIIFRHKIFYNKFLNVLCLMNFMEN